MAISTTKQKILTNGNWSPENPVVLQFPYARDLSELIRMRDEAFKWEQDHSNYEEQLNDQIALRDDQREYESPEAQLQRERAAGINPDLQPGGVGSSSGSGSSTPVPDMPDSTFRQSPTGLEVANTVFNGIGAVSSVVSAINVGFELFKGIRTFKDALKATKAGAETAQNMAAISGIDAAGRNLEFAGRIVDTLGDTADITDDVIKKAIADTGYNDADGTMFDTTKRMISSPQMQRLYADRRVQARAAQARDLATPFEFFRNLENNYAKITAYDAETELLDANFSNFIAKVYQSEENAEDIAANMTEAIQMETNALSLDQQSYEIQTEQNEQFQVEFKEYVKGYAEQVTFVANEIKKIDEKINTIRNPHETDPHYDAETQNAMLAALEVEKSQLMSKGCQTLSHCYGIVKRIARDSYLAPRLFETNKHGIEEIKTLPITVNHNSFMEILFSDVMNNGLTADNLLGNIMQAGVSIATAGMANITQMRGQNISAINQQRGQNMIYQSVRRGQNIRAAASGLNPYIF